MAVDYQMPPDVDQVVAQYTRSAEAVGLPDVAAQARYAAIRDNGKNVGIQAGINYQLHMFMKAIKKHERDLDTVYDFGPLMIKGRVVPPVISEVTDVYAQDDDNMSLTVAGVVYKIENQAKFSSVAPNWRSYLDFGQGNADFTPQVMGLNLKGKEKDIFEAAIREGYREGIYQGNEIVSHGFDRLNRDYKGMLEFHKQVLGKQMTMPVIAKSEMPMSHKGDTLVLDEKLLRLTVLPQFNTDMDKWKTWVKPSKLYMRVESVPVLKNPKRQKEGARRFEDNRVSGNVGQKNE
jgi:hypothetical protein